MKKEFLLMREGNRFGGNLNKLVGLGIILFNSLGVLVSVLLESRAFILGNLVALFCILFYIKNKRISLNKILFLLAIFAITLLSLTFCFKTGSSSGRFLIYKISWKMFEDNFFTGIGLGNFKTKYLLYQADYFRNFVFTESEMLLADNTYFAFNDFWQIIIETGLVGIIVILIILLIIAKRIRKAFINNEGDFFLLFSVAQLITIFIAAFFTHLFEKIIIQLLLLFFIGVIVFFSFKYDNERKVCFIFFLIICLTCICYHIRFKIFNYNSYKKLEYSHQLIGMGYHKESIKILEEIYDDYKDDHNYLLLLGNRLFVNGDFEQSVKVFELATQKRTNSELLCVLANGYIKTHKYELAEQALKQAIFMVPNRFYSRWQLFKLYYNRGDKVKALRLGNEILNHPVKIPSIRVRRIKEDVLRKINRSVVFNNVNITECFG